MSPNARAITTRTAAALWLAVTLYETQRPIGWMTPVPFWAVFTATMAGVDFMQNLVLFLPMGWIAHRAGWNVRRTVLVGALVSAGIEFGQIWVAGRTSTAMDIVCNTAGAALGWRMATPAMRPRVRLAIAFGALTALMTLHVLNTTWPDLADRVDGTGAWGAVNRVACPVGARASTVCITVPNSSEEGTKYVRVVGSGDRTYTRVQSHALNRPLARRDCVLLMFESTIGSQLRLRPPLRAACVLADSTDATIALRVDPRLEHEVSGEWTPTRASEWMWPVWPFSAYQPTVLRVAGAMAFVGLAALMTGVAPWVIPAGYLLMLECMALVAGMRGPGWWDTAWVLASWLVAVAAVRADLWWRRKTPIALR